MFRKRIILKSTKEKFENPCRIFSFIKVNKIHLRISSYWQESEEDLGSRSLSFSDYFLRTISNIFNQFIAFKVSNFCYKGSKPLLIMLYEEEILLNMRKIFVLMIQRLLKKGIAKLIIQGWQPFSQGNVLYL